MVDAFSLYYALATQGTRFGIESHFCYDSVRRIIFRFMDYLKAKNIIVDCVCIDTLIDPFKYEELCRRQAERARRYQEAWRSCFQHSRFHFLLP